MGNKITIVVDMNAKIFISYARKDSVEVYPIVDMLESNGLSCWIDKEGIESGSPEFENVILDAIDSSEVFLHMLSPNSKTSKYVKDEYQYAADVKKRIVTVLLHGAIDNPRVMFGFKTSDLIDIYNETQKEKLLRDLRKWVEKNNPSESSHADNGNNGNRPETTETEKAIEENDEKIKEDAPYISVKGKCGVKDLPDCSQLNCRLHNLELHVGDKLYVQDEGTSTTASIVGFNMRDKITRSYRPDRNGKVYVIIDVPIKQLTGKVKVTLQDTTPKNQVKTSTQGEPTVDESPLTREVVCSVCGKKEEITDFNMVEGVLFALLPIMGTLAYAGKKGYEKLKGGYICPECEAKKKKESMLDFKKFFNK